jgi:UTP:GlnB (protein PII) uridylyltransferase
MTWKFEIVATQQHRLLSRILQTLDTQLVSVHSFSSETLEPDVIVTFVVSSEQDKAYRIRAMLYRLEGVRDVAVLQHR